MIQQKFLLAIDTCGPAGSVALGRLVSGAVETLGQIELEGRSYSTTLVPAVRELLSRVGMSLSQLHAIVAVNGPGSFTGVRIGLSAVKGLAEPRQIPVIAASRLEVLAAKAGVFAAALDAHRHEVFLRLGLPDSLPGNPLGNLPDQGPKEILASVPELAAIQPAPSAIACCDEAAALLLAQAWPAAELVRTAPPTAADALRLAAPRIAAGVFTDLELLDGHYLRRSDAEIFGAPPAMEQPPSAVPLPEEN